MPEGVPGVGVGVGEEQVGEERGPCGAPEQKADERPAYAAGEDQRQEPATPHPGQVEQGGEGGGEEALLAPKGEDEAERGEREECHTLATDGALDQEDAECAPK